MSMSVTYRSLLRGATETTAMSSSVSGFSGGLGPELGHPLAQYMLDPLAHLPCSMFTIL